MLMVVADIARTGRAGAVTRSLRAPALPDRVPAHLSLSALSFSLLLACGLVSTSAAARSVIHRDTSAPGNQQPDILTTANGLPQVNIQTPSAGGVSLNKYTQFDVDHRGAILNNSHKPVQTQLGGWVSGNPFLARREARVIVNEVNSRNPGLLNGYVEVAGRRAQVVMANPSGITCSGCGFINANKVTLTTGQVRMQDGRIAGYDVSRGEVVVQGEGLDARGADYTEIFSRAVKVNGEIQARSLSMVAGRNHITAPADGGGVSAGEVTAKTDDGSLRPRYALDSSALGGMYANKITFIGTEKGLGVNMEGETAAMAGDIEVSADGEVHNRSRMQAGGDVSLRSVHGDTVNDGSVAAGRDLTVRAGGDVHNAAGGYLTANRDIRLTADGRLDSAGRTYAGRDATLRAGRDVTHGGSLVSGRHLSLDAARLQADHYSLFAAGYDRSGKPAGDGQLSLSTTGHLQDSGQMTATGDAQLQGADIALDDGTADARRLSLLAGTGSLSLRYSHLQAEDTLSLTSPASVVADSGQLQAAGLQITTPDLSAANGVLTQTGEGDLTLNVSRQMDLTGGLLATNSRNLTLSTRALAFTGGRIVHAGTGAFRLSADTLSGQRSDLLSNGNLTLAGQQADLTDGQLSAQGLTVREDTLNLTRSSVTQRGNGTLTVNVSGVTDGSGGHIQSAGDLALSTGSLTAAQGTLTAGGQMTVRSQRAADLRHATVQAGRALDWSSDGLDNADGIMTAGTDLRLSTGTAALNNTRGTLAAAGSFTLTSGGPDNTAGLLQSGGDMVLDTRGGVLINRDSGDHGGIVSRGTLRLSSGHLDNTSGWLVSAGDLQALTGDLDNAGGTLGSQQNLALTTLNLTSAGGLIQSGGSLTLSTQGHRLSNTVSGSRGGIRARGNAVLQTGEMDNHDGRLSAGGDLSLQAAGGMDNRRSAGVTTAGTESGGTLTLNAGHLDNTGGLLQSGGDMVLNTRGGTLTSTGSGDHGGILAGGNLSLQTGDMDNTSGFTGAQGSVTAVTGYLNNAQGRLVAGRALTLTADALRNARGTVQSGGPLQLQTSGTVPGGTAGVDNADGTLLAAGQTSLTTAALNNVRGQIQGGGLTLTTPGQVDNTSGKLLSTAGMRVTAAEADNAQGQIQSAGDQSLTLAGIMNNAQGLVRSGGALVASATQWINRLTAGENQGTEADRLTLTTPVLDNTQGALRTNHDQTLTVTSRADNTRGQVLAGGDLALSAGTVGNPDEAFTPAVINTGGQLSAGQSATLRAGRLTGDGDLQAGQRLDLALQQDFHNTGNITADRLALTLPGTLTNDGHLRGGHDLTLAAGTLDNLAAGDISADTTTLQLSRELDNRGLIDGGLTHITAPVIRNAGTGRLYGDHLALQADTLSNVAEDGSAPVIAARERLDTGAGTLDNRDGALLVSTGDMHIGGTLDAGLQARGQAGTVSNDGATMEADGSLSLSAGTVNNTNPGLVTQTVTVVSDEPHHEVVLSGQAGRTDWDKVTLTRNKYHVHTAHLPDGSNSDNFYEYRYTRNVTETQVKASTPGNILSGGNMLINAGVLNNTDSRVIAGGTLGGRTGILNNHATQGERVTTDRGDGTHWQEGKKHRPVGGTKTFQKTSGFDYRPAPVVQTTDLKTLTWQGNASPDIRATVSARDIARRGPATVAPVRVSGLAGAPGTVPAPSLQPGGDAPLVLPPGQTVSIPQGGSGPSATVVRLVAPDVTMPHNALYRVTPSGGQGFLVETDPRFTQKQQWLGTDVMQRAFADTPSALTTRLGDGYYEQRLVEQQVTQLTGQRYLPGYTSNEDQFRALMDAGIAFGKQFHLTPGVALSPDQMRLLTGDILWLVNETVTLPDGSRETVQVPQVYARLQPGDVTGDGAVLGGGNLSLAVAHQLNNTGSLVVARVADLTAGDLHNGGFIQADRVNVTTRGDLVNRGGRITGQDGVSLLAGHDLRVLSTLRGDDANRYTDRTAGIYVQAPDGQMNLAAVHDLTVTAGDIRSNGSARMTAGNDLTLNTLTTTDTENIDENRSNYRHLHQTTDAGSRVTTRGDLRLTAGHDLTATAAQVTAGGNLGAAAGHDLTLNTGTATTGLEENSKQSSHGLLSSYSRETHDEVHDRRALSSTFSGNTVGLLAGHDVTVRGSNAAGTQDVSLSAGHDLTVTTADEAHREVHMKQEKASGLLGSGGIGFTLGSSSQKSTTEGQGETRLGSTVGSQTGNVTLQAGRNALVHGSDLVAGQDLRLGGQSVTVNAAQNSQTTLQKYESHQGGLTVALSGAAGAALNTTMEDVQQARQPQDGRLQALAGVKAALRGVQAGQALMLNNAQQAAQQAGSGESAPEAFGVTASLGSQSSKSEQKTQTHTVSGSSLSAGRDIHIAATGDGQGHGGDITVQGSQAKAAHDITLDAQRDIQLLSGLNTQTLSGKNSSHGGSVGVGINAGQNTGITVSASVNAAHGHENGSTLTHRDTTLNAGHQVTLNAGRDATLKGAQVSGEQITAGVKRNLTLQSEQDSDRYDSKQQSAGAGASFTYGSMRGSASVSLSRDKIHSNLDSVKDQTGLFAGKGGFDVTTGNHTQLNGAVMASTATADKNRLDTGTLGFSDIKNRADFRTEHQSAGLSTGGNIGGQFAGNMANNLLVGAGHAGHADSTTQSAVSAGSITIRDTGHQKQDVSDLSRDAARANQTLSPIFDKEKEQRRLQQAQLIGEIGNQVADIARTEGEIAGEKAKRDPAALSQARAELEAKGRSFTEQEVAQRAYDNGMAVSGFGTGGKYQQAIQAATAAIQGLAGGNLNAALAGGAAPYIAEVIKQSTPEGAGRVAAHAVVNAALAVAQGKNALAGAAGAATGEVVGMIATEMYHKPVSELSETEKQTVSTLATVAAGLAGGLVGDSAASATAGAQSGKTTVDNNMLNVIATETAANTAAAIAGATGNASKDTGNDNDWDTSGGCEGTREQCAVRDPSRDGTRGPGHVLNSDNTDENKQPNLGKELAGATDKDKTELGGAGTGTPGGWGPDNEEKARHQEVQQQRFDELSKIYDKSHPAGELTVDGQTIRQSSVSNRYGTTKVFESQNLTDKQIHNYAQQLAGDTPLKEVKSGIYTSKLSDGSVITLRNISTSEGQTGARWTIDIRNNQKLTELGNKYSRVEIKFK